MRTPTSIRRSVQGSVEATVVAICRGRRKHSIRGREGSGKWDSWNMVSGAVRTLTSLHAAWVAAWVYAMQLHRAQQWSCSSGKQIRSKEPGLRPAVPSQQDDKATQQGWKPFEQQGKQGSQESTGRTGKAGGLQTLMKYLLLLLKDASYTIHFQ